jgi:hypothetical protein
MLNNLIIRTIKNGYSRYCNGQNYINNGYSVYLDGTTLVVKEVCINDYGSIFDCFRNYSIYIICGSWDDLIIKNEPFKGS